jgi:hypothetical protein
MYYRFKYKTYTSALRIPRTKKLRGLKVLHKAANYMAAIFFKKK